MSATAHFLALVPTPPSLPLFCLSAASSYSPITFSMFTTCQLSYFFDWPRPGQLLSPQFLTRWRHFCFSIWCAIHVASHQAPQWLALWCLPRLPGSATDISHPGCRYHSRRAVAHETVTEHWTCSSIHFFLYHFLNSSFFLKNFLYSISFNPHIWAILGVWLSLNNNFSPNMSVFIDWFLNN